MAFAHANLIVHRDLKPGNILVTEQGGLFLVTWQGGLSLVTGLGGLSLFGGMGWLCCCVLLRNVRRSEFHVPRWRFCFAGRVARNEM